VEGCRYILREEKGVQTSAPSLYLEESPTADRATDEYICVGQVRPALRIVALPHFLMSTSINVK